MPLTGRVKSVYEWFKEREGELQLESERNGGKLEMHNLWRLAYYNHPYLLLETDDSIKERFADVFSNGIDISSDGKISFAPMMMNDGRFSRLFTELIEETNWRGILTRNSITEVSDQINSYFSDGMPLGARMFQGKTEIKDQWLLKFSKREFVYEMHRRGRFRISPASYYAKGSHIRAVKDLETARNYKLKAINEVLEGKSEITFSGRKIPIKCGVVPLQFMMEDYYLFSTCREISRRMPTDFEADAALIIKDKPTFIRRIKDRLLKKLPGWEFLAGKVYYYDPYNDIPKDRNQEFWKHFAYAYQREHRCVIRPKYSKVGAGKLEPFFIEIGPLDDISEVVVPT